MTLRLHPHDPIVWRSPTSVRIGDGKAATVFTDTDEPFERLLDELHTGIASGTLAERAIALGMSPTRAASTTEMLLPHLLDADAGYVPPVLDHTRRSRSSTNMALDNRARATVCIDGLNEVGLLVAWMLAERGIGHIVCLGDSVVGATQDGTGILDQLLTKYRFVGADKAEALAEAVHDNFGTTCSFDPPAQLELAVITAAHAIHPYRHQYWLRRDTPHLAVVSGVHYSLVTHTVLPGHGACLDCLGTQLTGLDPHWPAMQAQLVACSYPTQDSLRASVVAAAVAEQALAAIDHPVRIPDNQLKWFDGLHLRTDIVVPQDDCGCMQIRASADVAALDPDAIA